MRFENIKIDDIIFVKKLIRYAYSSGKSFFIPTKVIAVTKTQFKIENGDRFYKEDSRQFGDRWNIAYKEGEKTEGLDDGRFVKDETAEMEAFELKLNKEKDINNIVKEIVCPRNSTFDMGVLNDIYERLQRIKTTLDNK